MREFLAVDAGGTSTRAVVVDETGRCLGSGRSSGGNPTSRGVAAASAAVRGAIAQALADSSSTTPPSPAAIELVLLAHAGAGVGFHDEVRRGIAPLGVRAPVVAAGDLLALFASGTPALDGAALIAGTGAIGGAIRDGRLDRVVDGTGWLLGDAGSGFWIGHHIARAVVDDLDGGPATRLTAALLAELALDDDRTLVHGRPVVLGRLVHALYDLQPVELARFAPLAFAVVDGDDVATAILRDSVAALAALLRRVRSFQADGPLVFGGSVLVEGVLRLSPTLQAPLLDAADGALPIPVADGLVGAAVLALRERGVEVDEPLFIRMRSSIRAAAAIPRP